MELPRGCALDRAMRGEVAEWTVTDYLLTTQINDHRLFNSGKKRLPKDQQLRPPEAGPQPRQKAPVKAEEKALGAAELDALFTGGG